MRVARVAVVIAVLAVTGCDGDDAADRTDPPTTTATTDAAGPTSASAATVPATPATAPTTTGPPAPTDPPAATTEPPATTPPVTAPATAAPATTAPTLVDVKVYLLRGERLAIAHRLVPGPAVMRGALEALLDGPTAGEIAAGLHSEIPDGTTLRDLNLAAGLATVDLSPDYERGGGTASMTARVAQIVFTATQFDNADEVRFWLDGAPIELLGGEGIVVGEPLARADTERAFTGGIIIDAPAPGETVRSPFPVTGEGDVFEASFPIEIWANGVRVGEATLGTAGASGDWRDFEALVTTDAPAGPIELIAFDAGGCGDAPECPEIVRTVIPLILTR